MDQIAGGRSGAVTESTREVDYFNSLVDILHEPGLVLDKELIISANTSFFDTFNFSPEEVIAKSLLELQGDGWRDQNIQDKITEAIDQKKGFRNLMFNPLNGNTPCAFLLNGGLINHNARDYLLLTFRYDQGSSPKHNTPDYKSLESILAHAPAMICMLRGPEFIYELANEKYFQLVGKREILGKPVREAVPEAEGQGFFELLDQVKRTGKPHVGCEVPIQLNVDDTQVKSSFLDFVYQPIFDPQGEVERIFVYVTDVTEKVLVRKQVEQSEAELREIIDAVPAMIWITNKHGNSTYLNKNWYDYTGQDFREPNGLGWVEATHPEDRLDAEERFRNADRNQKAYSGTFRIRNKHGEYRWVIDRGRPKYSLDGVYEGMIGTLVDVHEERIKEQELAEAELKYRELIYTSPYLISTFKGEDHIIEIANDAIIEAWGKGPDVIGRPLFELLPEVVDQGLDKILKEVYSSGNPYRGYEMPLHLERNGKLELFHFNFIYSPQRDIRGNIVGIVNMATEVTSQAVLNKTIKESETHFRQVADLMPTKVSNTDAQGFFKYFNQGWLDYTGLTSDQLKEKGWANLIHANDREDFETRWNRSLETGENFEMELRCLNKHGKYKWHLSRAEPVKDESGKISMWISTNTEIQKLKEEEKRKGDFLKMVSHELKTPVTSIKGYVQLLLSLINREKGESSLSSIPLKPSLERIDHQIKRLTRLISEMLDLSRIEENKLEFQKRTFSLNELVDETVQDIMYTNTQHHIEVIHAFKCHIFADRDRIGQVLINFITNAIKYSPESKDIVVKIQKHKNNQVSVSVKDQGIGIEKKNHKNIFKRFYRIGGKSEETYSGFGIGLYLANEIIQRHNGSITVKSKKGKGSDFCFIIAVASEK